MKTLLVLPLFAVLPVLGSLPAEEAAPTTAPTNWEVDPVHSAMIFRIQHAGTSYFYGRFNAIAGKVTLDPEKLEASTVEIKVKADSIDTANQKRDGHLKSPDFFDAKQFPQILFKSTKIRKLTDHTYEVTGDLELRGVKKPVTFEVEHTGDGEFDGKTRTGYEATLSVKRSDFGMSYGVEKKVLGDEVRVTFGLELIKL